MDFSIVIPTFKEEKYLPKLLGSIKKQTLQPKEIIVADNNSPDRTGSIAKEFGCKVVQGGNPGEGRNNGAKIAQSSTIVFLDADCQMVNNNFLGKTLSFYDRHNLKIAVGFFKNQPDNKLFSKLNIAFNNMRKIIDWILAKLVKTVLGGNGAFLVISKEAFIKVHGFNETMESYEDTTFIKDVVREGYKFGIIPYLGISLSGRRYDKMSFLQLIRTSLHIFAFKVGLGNKKEQLKKYESSKGALGGD